MSYAANTSVSVERSRIEIERLLRKANAERIRTDWDDRNGLASIAFAAQGRLLRFDLPLPKRQAFSTRIVRGREIEASPEQQEKAWEQACREKWRALLLAIKSKIVSVEAGVESFEQAFYAHIVMPNKQTMFEATHKQLEAA